jgi:hypothetical protein
MGGGARPPGVDTPLECVGGLGGGAGGVPKGVDMTLLL